MKKRGSTGRSSSRSNDKPSSSRGGRGESSDKPKRSYGGSNDDRPKRSYGDSNEKPKRSFGGDREERPKRPFSSNDDRPKRSYDDKPSGQKRSYGPRDEKPKPFGGDREERPRRSFDDRDEKPKRSFGGDREERPRRSFDDRDQKPKRSFGGDREERSRKPFGDRDVKPKRSFGGDREERPRRSFDDRDEKPKRSFGGDKEERPRKPFGDRDEKPKRSFGGDREERPRRAFDDRDEKPKRSFGGDREERPRKSYDDRDEKPKRSFGGDREERPRRSFDDRDEKPKHPFGGEREERPKRAYSDSDEKPKRSYDKDAGEKRYERKESGGRVGFKKKDKTPSLKKQLGIDDGDKQIRLNRYISMAGICSRREADDMIAAGVISVNGTVITELGAKVSLEDDVRYNGERIRNEKLVYVLLNKPKDYITTMEDPESRKTVMELVANACKERIYPVGRLDRNTTGLLLFTNDGDLAKALTHPSSRIKKIYHAELDKSLKVGDMKKLIEGVKLDDGVEISVDDIAFDGDGSDKKMVGLEIHSGQNRVVRRMFESIGYEVRKLDRVVFAGLTKKDLPRGRWRLLSDTEVGMLKMNISKKAR